MYSRTPTWITLSLFIACLLLSQTSCKGKHDDFSEAKPPAVVGAQAATPAGSDSITVARISIPEIHQLVGSIQPGVRARIEAKVQARIETIRVRPGAVVQQGDVLVELDKQELKARADQAIALRDQAKRDYERIKKVANSGAISSQDLERASSQADAREAAAREALTFLQYATIKAPYGGTVVSRQAEPGDTIAPGKPILEIEDISALRFETEVPEALIDFVKLGSEVTIRVGVESKPLRARISEISPSANTTTRSFLVKADLSVAKEIRTGVFARLELPIGKREGLVVPCSAIHYEGQLETVQIWQGEKTTTALVRVGKRFDTQCEILSGLKAGDKVARDGNRSELPSVG